MKKREDQLVEKIAEKLQAQFKNIYFLRKPSTSPKIKKYLKQELGFIPLLQPEIDLCFETHNSKLMGIEAKLFEIQDISSYKLSYYVGIGQALALLNYGFDHAGLWYFFFDKNNKGIDNFNQQPGAQTWHFIRNTLNLPIEFSYFYVTKEKNNDYKFTVMQYISSTRGFSLGLDISDPKFRITWKHKNPIIKNLIAKKIRIGLELWFNEKL